MAGEYLDHPSHRFRTVQARTRATDDFDALDLLHRDALQGCAAGSGRTDSYAIDQDQHVLVAAAADRYRSTLATPAIAGDADPGQTLQQLRHAARLLTLDVITGNQTRGSNGRG